MEACFRYVALFALVARLVICVYYAYRPVRAGTLGRRLARPELLLFSNLWMTIAVTFWVTALLVCREYPLS